MKISQDIINDLYNICFWYNLVQERLTENDMVYIVAFQVSTGNFKRWVISLKYKLKFNVEIYN